MLINCLIAIFLLYCFSSVFFLRKNDSDNAITKTDSVFLRSIAIVYVVLHHICKRLSSDFILDLLMLRYSHIFVATFFFLSGYGNCLSLSREGISSSSWLWKRSRSFIYFYVLGFFINFLVSLNCIDSYKTIIMDFFTFKYGETILWYFIVLYCLYILTFLGKIIFKKDDFLIKQSLFLLVICVIYVCICYLIKIPGFWWNSVIAYPLGFIYSIIKKKRKINLFTGLFIFVLFLISLLLYKYNIIQFLSVILLCFCFGFFFQHFSFHVPSFYCVFGKISLSIYLYHLIFLNLWAKYLDDKPVFIILIIGCTLLMGIFSNIIFGKIEGKKQK